MTTTIGSLDLNAFSDLYNDSNQYFWFEGNASATYGAGVHVTLVPNTSFISNPTGQNVLINTDGFSIRNGLLPMMTLDNYSLDFNIVDTTAGTCATAATFGLNGSQIGQSTGAHTVIDAKGQKFFADDGQTLLARFGKDSENGKTSVREVQVVKVNSLSYNMEHSIDVDESMSVTTNTGVSLSFTITQSGGVLVDSSAADYSYLVFTYFTQDTIYDYSLSSNDSTYHANGAFSANGGIAYGLNSHAINGGTACGYNSHAQGTGTVALGTAQCVIGAYNDMSPYTTTGTVISRLFYPFVIGNGTADDERSNAFTVDWNGRVQCGDYSGTFKSIFDIFYPVGSYYETSLASAIPSGGSTPDATDLANLGVTWFDPNYAWGGTWELETAGRFNISAGTGYALGATGGNKDAAVISHYHNPSTTSEYFVCNAYSEANNTRVAYSGSGNRLVDGLTSTGTSSFHHRKATQTVGESGTNRNLPPYVAVNRWHRTA